MKSTVITCWIICALSLTAGCDLGTYSARFESRPANPVGPTGAGAGSDKKVDASVTKAAGSDKKNDGSETKAAGSDTRSAKEAAVAPANDNHDQLADDLLIFLTEMTGIFETVDSSKSAKAAIPKIEALEGPAEMLASRFKALGPRDSATEKRIKEGKAGELQAIVNRLIPTLTNLAKYPKVLNAMKALKAKTPEPSYVKP